MNSRIIAAWATCPMKGACVAHCFTIDRGRRLRVFCLRLVSAGGSGTSQAAEAAAAARRDQAGSAATLTASPAAANST